MHGLVKFTAASAKREKKISQTRDLDFSRSPYFPFSVFLYGWEQSSLARFIEIISPVIESPLSRLGVAVELVQVVVEVERARAQESGE